MSNFIDGMYVIVFCLAFLWGVKILLDSGEK